MIERLRAFADSNVMLSACLGVRSDFRFFWEIPEVDILTSQYSIAEVSRNLRRPDDRARLWALIYKSHLVPDDENIVLPSEIYLPAKDRPIMQAAIAAGADVLISGDLAHFGPYWGKEISGVTIESPRMFKDRYPQQFEGIL